MIEAGVGSKKGKNKGENKFNTSKSFSKKLAIFQYALKDIENLAIILVPLIMILSRGHTGQIKG